MASDPPSTTSRWLANHRSIALLPIPDELARRLERQARSPRRRFLLLGAGTFAPWLTGIALGLLIEGIPDAVFGWLVIVGAVAAVVATVIAMDTIRSRDAALRDLRAGTIERFEIDPRIRADLVALAALGREWKPAATSDAIDVLSGSARLVRAVGCGLCAGPRVRIAMVAEIPGTMSDAPFGSGGLDPPAYEADACRPLSPAELDELRGIVRSERVRRPIIVAIILAWFAAMAGLLAVNGEHWYEMLGAGAFATIVLLGILAFALAAWFRRRLRRDIERARVDILDRDTLRQRLADVAPRELNIWQGAEWLRHADRYWTLDGVPAMWRRSIRPD